VNKLRFALAVAAVLAAAPSAFAQRTPASADTSASALHWAAHNNDLGAVKRLLSEGADANLANRFGVTPLHEASIVRNADMLELMLDAGGDANASFGEGETVLMTAARAGDAESVRVLLAHGGLPDTTENWHGQTALMWAAIENHADVVELLIDAGADASLVEPMYQLTPLQLAIVNGHYTLAKRLIERGVEVDDGSLYLAIDTRNLGYYAQRPNPPEKDGEVTSLDVVNTLLERGANADLPYAKGIPERTVAGEIAVPPGATPLDRAAAASDFAAVETLLKHGASATVVTEDGTTPLMLLAGYSRARGAAKLSNDPKRLELMRTLLEKGTDVHAVHKDSTNNALFFAKQRGTPEMIALLEEFGAREATAAN
jgi:ankyrin repeat protein